MPQHDVAALRRTTPLRLTLRKTVAVCTFSTLVAGASVAYPSTATATAPSLGTSVSTAYRIQGPDVLELGVSGALAAMESGETTSAQLTQQFLDRIAVYDGQVSGDGGLASFVTVNEDALTEAAALDAERTAGELRGPLHGVPIIVKDNIDTADMPTSHGNQALATFQPASDATSVKRLKDAGAIILGKGNMAEFAKFWDTYSSVRGRTLNPYDQTKNINGSSGGPATAVASSLASVGIGTESCGSITDVASFSNLVGLRPTPGLVSKAGSDYSLVGDSAGPLALSVEDAALTLDALAGTDPADPLTADADSLKPDTYTSGLKTDSLDGVRVGYMVEPLGTTAFTIGEKSASILSTLATAIDDLEAQGATVVPITVSSQWKAEYIDGRRFSAGAGGRQDYFTRTEATWPEGLAAQTEPFDQLNYADLPPASERMDDYTKTAVLAGNNLAPNTSRLAEAKTNRAHFAEGVSQLYADNDIDVLTYPTMAYPSVSLHDDPIATSVDAEQLGTSCGWANWAGFPVVSVPAGFSDDDMPVGMSMLGLPNTEASLLGYAYDYEQATAHRTAPASTPTLASAATTATKVTVKPSTIRYGAASTVKAAVTAADGVTATGEATLTIGNRTPIRATLSGGTATFAVPRNLRPGLVTLTVSYLGDRGSLASTGTATVRVKKAKAVVGLKLASKTVSSGRRAKATISARLEGASSVPVGGTVYVYDGAKRIATRKLPSTSNTIVLSLPVLKKGTHPLSVRLVTTSTHGKDTSSTTVLRVK